MESLKITSEKILKALSEKWQSWDEIAYKLQIHDDLDIRYLNLRLKEFFRKNKIKFIYHKGKKYWKLRVLEELPIKVPYNIADVFELEEYIEIKNYIDFYTQIVKNDPNDIQAWDELAYYYHETSSDKIILCLEKLVDLDPFDEETWQYLGDEYFVKKDFKMAIKSYENALRFASNDIDPYFKIRILKDLGQVYYENEDFQKAIEYYEKALKSASNDDDSLLRDIDLLLHLGGSHTLLRQPDEAIKYFQNIIELDSKISSAWDGLGLAYAIKKEFDKAFEYVKKASELDPNFNFYDLVLEEKERYMQEDLQEPTYEDQINQKEKLILDDRIFSLLQEQIEKFDKLIKISEFSAKIHIKSYINDLIKPFFENPSNRKIRKLKKSFEQYIEDLPKEKREEFYKEYSRTIRRYEEMQPSKWKKWGTHLIKLVSILR